LGDQKKKRKRGKSEIQVRTGHYEKKVAMQNVVLLIKVEVELRGGGGLGGSGLPKKSQCYRCTSGL